jgi:hypothetical protein
MPFTTDANVEGRLEEIRINRETNRGYYLLRATKSATVNVQDEDSLTGQGKAQIGEIIGLRKTGATKVLSDLAIGTLVSVTYLGMEDREGLNPRTGKIEMHPYHNLSIDVYKPESEEIA